MQNCKFNSEVTNSEVTESWPLADEAPEELFGLL